MFSRPSVFWKMKDPVQSDISPGAIQLPSSRLTSALPESEPSSSVSSEETRMWYEPPLVSSSAVPVPSGSRGRSGAEKV